MKRGALVAPLFVCADVMEHVAVLAKGGAVC
jgi:hypothetical protein